jgi:hydrogenase nickel incorporation protein HypA/HybF
VKSAVHEFSLVRSLLSQVRALVREHGGAEAEEVRVEIGPLAGVEPLLVESAFSQLVESSEMPHARVVIDQVPLEGLCTGCHAAFEIERFRFVCPQCGSGQVRVTRGDEFRLMSVTIRDVPAVEAPAP